MYHEEENTGCISSFKRCWAAFFHKKDENETVRLMHPSAEYSSLITIPEEHIDVTDEGKIMWQHYVKDRYNFSDESQYPLFTQDAYIMTCYKKLLSPASHGDKECIAIIDQFPGPLRLMLDAKIHDEIQLIPKNQTSGN